MILYVLRTSANSLTINGYQVDIPATSPIMIGSQHELGVSGASGQMNVNGYLVSDDFFENCNGNEGSISPNISTNNKTLMYTIDGF